jgi:hypothetical protein
VSDRTWTAPQAGWYQWGDPPRLLTDAEARDIMTAQVTGRDAPRMVLLAAGAGTPADPAEPEEPEVAWLRRQVEMRRGLARRTVELGSSLAWDEPSSGVLVTGEPPDGGGTWDGTWPLGDSSLTRLMAASDPQDTLARCEAELALLDEHGGEHMCYRSGRDGSTWDWWIGDCLVMTTLAGAYRHHEGWAEHWGAEKEEGSG